MLIRKLPRMFMGEDPTEQIPRFAAGENLPSWERFGAKMLRGHDDHLKHIETSPI